MRYGMPKEMVEQNRALPNIFHMLSGEGPVMSMVIHVYIVDIEMISAMHQSIYRRYVMSNRLFDLYMSMRLMISVRTDAAKKRSVNMNIPESPSLNQAVSENGMYMFRNTTANNTEKVTVPISWYLPSRYGGSFVFILQVLVKQKYAFS